MRINQENKPNIAGIYNSWIHSENDKNVGERYVGKEKYYHASGANMCIRKHYFATHPEIPKTDESDMIGQRVMRLGTLFHNDMEIALNWYKEKKSLTNRKETINKLIYNNTNTSSNSTIELIDNIELVDTEGEIILPDLNVRGFYDVVFKMKTGEVFLYDFKTIRAYGYKLKFGRLENRKVDKVPTHEVQLATYGLGVKEKYGRLDGMFLFYFNKDSAMCKEKEVNLEFMDVAKDYWREVNELTQGSVPPPVREDESPLQSWECNYCNYATYCQEN